MKRALRVGLWMLAALIPCLGAAVLYVYFGLPRVEPANQQIHAATSGSAIERGQYLAEHVAICMDCHSQRDYSRFSGPLIESSKGQGGEVFGHAFGLPGELVAANITPDRETGVGSWSDAELTQAITAGVTPDGRALFPFMNYMNFSQMCRSDMEALLGYLRQLPAKSQKHPASQLDFPVNLIVRTMPKSVELSEHCPSPSDGVAYGKYLATLANCADCHTRREGGAPVPGQDFAGGMTFPMPSGYVAHSANITPDADSGIGRWSKEQFVQRFAAYRDPAALAPVHAGDVSTPMPWAMFAGMSDADLGAIYDYLRTLAPVSTGAAKAVASR